LLYSLRTFLHCLPSPFYHNLQGSKATFFAFKKFFTVEKSHPPELSLAGDPIGRFEGYLIGGYSSFLAAQVMI
jgi:hypothetical protein